MRDNKPFKILIAEFIPVFNKGELAILNGILKSLEVLGNVEVFIFSFLPELDKSRYPNNIRLVDMNYNLYLKDLPYHKSKIYAVFAKYFVGLQHLIFTFLFLILRKTALKIMWKPLWRIYYESDVYLTCTNEIDCVNGGVLNFSPLYICWLAKALKKPIVFYANGTNISTCEVWIWNFHSRRLWQVLAKYIFRMVDLVTVRESHTLQFFKKVVGDKAPIYLTADLAFLSSAAKEERINEIMLKEGIIKSGGPLIGFCASFNVLSFAFKNTFSQNTLSDFKARYGLAVRELASFLDRLITEYNSTIVFIPHVIEPFGYRDDRKVAKDIYGLMLYKNRARLILNEYSAEEWKGVMGKLDLLISSRIHAAVSAISMGTPVLVLTKPFDERSYYILGEMCKLKNWIYNVENLNSEELFSLTKELLKLRDKISNELLIHVNYVKRRAMLNGKLLKQLLNFYNSRTN